jgi:hypothetical protein
MGHIIVGHRWEQVSGILDWGVRKYYAACCLWRWVDDNTGFLNRDRLYSEEMRQRTIEAFTTLGIPLHKVS